MAIPKFKNPKLLEVALTHRSYLNEAKKHLNSNERLEFLGDSILSFIISTNLYKKFPDYEEGQLTNFRSSLVKTTTLARTAEKIGIGEKIKMSKGEEISGGRNNPSLLADTFEAIIGALYLDQGLKAVEEFLDKTLITLIPKLLERGTLKDYKSLLQEKIQNLYKKSPEYKVEEETGPDHAKNFMVGVYYDNKIIGKGCGASKQKAQQEAAKSALESYDGNLIK